MRHLNPWQSYRQVATQTAPPGQIVLMLFEGAIRFLESATAGFGLDDPAESITAINNNVIRAQQIVRELNACLDMEQGGELAVHLQRLYGYCDRRLQESNLRKSPEGIADVIKRFSDLRDAWAQMLRSGDSSISAEEPFRLARLAA